MVLRRFLAVAIAVGLGGLVTLGSSGPIAASAPTQPANGAEPVGASATLEPRRGALEFGWLDRAVSLLAAQGIDVVLGTPTAAPPGWLIAEHPDILPVDHVGRVFPFGHRRHYCPNNPTYHQESRRIVAALAERYGADERVVALQIDNEFGERCYCPRCEVAFREWLEERKVTRVGGLAASQVFDVPWSGGRNSRSAILHRRYPDHAALPHLPRLRHRNPRAVHGMLRGWPSPRHPNHQRQDSGRG